MPRRRLLCSIPLLLLAACSNAPPGDLYAAQGICAERRLHWGSPAFADCVRRQAALAETRGAIPLQPPPVPLAPPGAVSRPLSQPAAPPAPTDWLPPL